MGSQRTESGGRFTPPNATRRVNNSGFKTAEDYVDIANAVTTIPEPPIKLCKEGRIRYTEIVEAMPSNSRKPYRIRLAAELAQAQLGLDNELAMLIKEGSVSCDENGNVKSNPRLHMVKFWETRVNRLLSAVGHLASQQGYTVSSGGIRPTSPQRQAYEESIRKASLHAKDNGIDDLLA